MEGQQVTCEDDNKENSGQPLYLLEAFDHHKGDNLMAHLWVKIDTRIQSLGVHGLQILPLHSSTWILFAHILSHPPLEIPQLRFVHRPCYRLEGLFEQFNCLKKLYKSTIPMF